MMNADSAAGTKPMIKPSNVEAAIIANRGNFLYNILKKNLKSVARIFFNRIDCSVGVATKIIPLACSLNSLCFSVISPYAGSIMVTYFRLTPFNIT